MDTYLRLLLIPISTTAHNDQDEEIWRPKRLGQEDKKFEKIKYEIQALKKNSIKYISNFVRSK